MKKMKVVDFLLQFGAAGDDIPVIVTAGFQQLATAKNAFKAAAIFAPGILEAKIQFVTLKRDGMTIQIKL